MMDTKRPWIELLVTLWRQAVYALAWFVACALAYEHLVPGSVTPYLDPLPLAAFALLMLAADAMLRPAMAKKYARLAFGGLAIAVLAALAWTSATPSGRSDLLALCIMLGLSIAVLIAAAAPRNGA